MSKLEEIKQSISSDWQKVRCKECLDIIYKWKEEQLYMNKNSYRPIALSSIWIYVMRRQDQSQRVISLYAAYKNRRFVKSNSYKCIGILMTIHIKSRMLTIISLESFFKNYLIQSYMNLFYSV